MKLFIFISLLCVTFTGDKLDPKDKVFIVFKETPGQPNTEEGYAKGILTEYIKNKSSLVLVEKAEEADYTFVLYVYEKGQTNMGKIDIVKAGTGNAIFESSWTVGKAKMFYGYSGVRHSIGTIFNQQILGKYPHIEADNKP
jgi:hypothetical protein